MTKQHHYTRADLENFAPHFKTFVGIDSDGCIFPTMDIKQKVCFHTQIISFWHLEPIERAVRQAAEFVNLHSIYRGQNRFTALLKTFELLLTHPGALAANIELPSTASLRSFCDSGLPLSNAALQTLVENDGDPELARLLAWSLAVNQDVATKVKDIKPFRWVIESLRLIKNHSDAICVSQTPTEALVREWEEHDLIRYVSIIAGQELGSKAEHLTLATSGRYPVTRVLLLGDAPGDLKAARAVGVRFFPINPGDEEKSWEVFYREAYPRFLDNCYDDAYEMALIRKFEEKLPSLPPWETP